MLNFLEKIVLPPSPAAQSVAAPPTPTPVDLYILGLHDAMLSGWFNQETDELFSGFPVSTEDTVLDVGCGNDDNVHFYAMHGARIIIANIDAEKIARTCERLTDTPARELECLVSDYDPLSLADTTAARVVSTEIIEHVDDLWQFPAELVRAGQSGALYLLSVPHPTSGNLQKDFATDEYFRRPSHIHVLDKEQSAALMREVELEILSHSRYGSCWSLWVLLFWGAKVDFDNPDRPLFEH